MVPGFRPAAIRRDPLVEGQYAALEAAALEGRRPQAGMWKRIQAAVAMLQNNGQWGEVIPQTSIPAYFQATYGATNLYCIDLSRTVRCFYTIQKQGILFLDIVDHDEYDKWFPPKGRRRRR